MVNNSIDSQLAKIKFWKEKLLSDQIDAIETTNRYNKTLERFMLAAEGKETTKMAQMYEDWRGMQPKGTV